MKPLADSSSLAWLGEAMLVVIAASVTIWIVVIARWWRRLPVIRYEPRLPVPWGGGHVLLMLLVYAALGSIAGLTVHYALPADHDQPQEAATPSTLHPLARMVEAAHGNLWVLAAAALAAVVAAPIVEEFFFRVLLQGWLEAAERRHRRLVWVTWGFLPGATPILASSLLFAALHFRLGEKAPPPLAAIVIADAVAKLLAMAGIIMLLRVQRGARAVDFGWVPQKLAADAGLGLLASLAVIPVVFLMQWLCQNYLFPLTKVAADPLPLFFFALVLGTIYYRTHRIVPSIVTHAALNATTLVLLYLQ